MQNALLKTESTREDALRAFYLETLELVTLGLYTAASDALRDLREVEVPEPAREAIRKLISARISIKKGMSSGDLEWVEMSFPLIPWIAPESQFVLGLNDFHQARFSEGTEKFEKARRGFAKLGLHDRELLSHFNSTVGRMAADKIPGPAEKLSELQLVEVRARECGHVDCQKVLAMVLRQKSHIFEEQGRLQAALEEISGAVDIFGKIGPVSDHHLALLSATDLCLNLGEVKRAGQFFERVLPPVDTRVEFPLAYIRWRLGGPMPSRDAFGSLPGGWKEKFEKLQNVTLISETIPELVWNLKDSQFGPDSLSLKIESLDGKLIRLLIQGRASKNFLIEALWPESGSAQHLDNRLHRVISRTNQRFGKLITFDGQFYRLTSPVRLV